jgi:hypothetical protein
MSTEAPPAAEGNVLGDFVLPDWQNGRGKQKRRSV